MLFRSADVPGGEDDAVGRHAAGGDGSGRAGRLGPGRSRRAHAPALLPQPALARR
jgi:hypothetical protein